MRYLFGFPLNAPMMVSLGWGGVCAAIGAFTGAWQYLLYWAAGVCAGRAVWLYVNQDEMRGSDDERAG